MIFDSHCHLQFPQYDKDREEVISKSLSSGVGMICVGTDPETSKQGIRLAQKYESMWATVGVHPNDVSNFQFSIRQLADNFQKLLEQPKVVAIGEVGLDYYRTTEPEKQNGQKEVFKQFLELATKHNKPLVIHCRDAAKGTIGRVHQDMIGILAEWYFSNDREINTKSIKTFPGVMHSFTGSTEQARKYIEMGFYLGFNGIITFSKQYDDVVKYVPLDNILLETDAPFLAPEPYRGKRNEPLYVKEVAKKVAELKNEPLEKVIEQTTQNCKKLFNRLNV